MAANSFPGNSNTPDLKWQQHVWGEVTASPRAPVFSRRTNGDNEEDGFEDESLYEWGVFLVAIGALSAVGWMLALIAPLWLFPSGSPGSEKAREDWYYLCMLIPMTIPVAITAVWMHWLSMKLFKHA